MKILAIGAHPDDIEIFMYGLLATYKKRGDDIFLVIATDGGAGNVNNSSNLIKKRENETILGLKKLGRPTFLNFSDGCLSYLNEAQKVINELIKSIQPDLIITHAPDDYHHDHRALSNYITQNVGFSCPVIFCDTLMGINFNPDFYIDISEFFEEKCKSINAHESQNPMNFIEVVTLMNRYRSAQCNAPENNYAEAYRFNKRFPFSDIRLLIPDPPKYRPFYNNNLDSLV